MVGTHGSAPECSHQFGFGLDEVEEASSLGEMGSVVEEGLAHVLSEADRGILPVPHASSGLSLVAVMENSGSDSE